MLIYEWLGMVMPVFMNEFYPAALLPINQKKEAFFIRVLLWRCISMHCKRTFIYKFLAAAKMQD
jgi:hypothetical protein